MRTHGQVAYAPSEKLRDDKRADERRHQQKRDDKRAHEKGLHQQKRDERALEKKQ